MSETKFTPIIGLEVHIELATESKMFCGCPADHFGMTPNSHTCPVCLGLPGALPVPNKKAIEWSIMLGLALGCTIAEHSKFDRKNYFYPDLPKGYQISQYDEPLCVNGKIVVNGKEIRIRRVHLEEDTGKLQHTEIDGKKATLVDFNRSGVPLVEVVTEPDFRTIEDVDAYLKKLQQIVRYLAISLADMEKGSMRLEPSISIALGDGEVTDHNLPGYRVELKNINSFRFARHALEYEISRQTEALTRGEVPQQETRGWNEAKGISVLQRSKEDAQDYRYFPEPDIPPMHFPFEEVEKLKKRLPELPDVKILRFINDYQLPEYDASILCETRDLADYFEQAVQVGSQHSLTPKAIANWLINKKIEIITILPAELIKSVVESRMTTKVSSEEIENIITEVIKLNPKAVADFKNGNANVLGFLLGQVAKIKRGVDSAVVKKYLLDKLG